MLLVLASVGCRSTVASGDPALRDQYGELHRPLHPAAGAVNVLVFVATDCPIANAYAPEIQSIAGDYEDRGVTVHLVYVDPDLERASADAHAREWGYRLPALIDAQQALVEATGVSITPEAVVVTPGGTVAYRGRIDDRYPALGRRRQAPARRDLREALDDVLAGRPVEVPETRAVGCFVPEPR